MTAEDDNKEEMSNICNPHMVRGSDMNQSESERVRRDDTKKAKRGEMR